MQTIESNSFLIREPAEDYHAKARQFLTSHQLGDFRKCPFLYFKKRHGLVADEGRPAFLVGRATHTLILEGKERFEEEYAVGGPINPKTGKVFGSSTKTWTEWAEAQGRHVLTEAQFELVNSMAIGVAMNDRAEELLCEGVAEGVVRADYRGLPCQIRMDFLDPHRGIVDLKTCDDLTWFEADAKRYGYVYQLAFYRAVLRQVIGLAMPVFFLAVEKKEPFRSGVWQVHEDVLNQAERENEAAIQRLKQATESDTWPTGYEEVRLFDSI